MYMLSTIVVDGACFSYDVPQNHVVISDLHMGLGGPAEPWAIFEIP